MSAKKNLMEKLHALLAGALVDQIENGSTAIDKETGEVVQLATPAAVLSVARQFLKDNNIEATGDNEGLQKLGSVTKGLPFSVPDEHGLPQ